MVNTGSNSNTARRTLTALPTSDQVCRSRGRKIPALSALGIPIAQVDPREGHRLQTTGTKGIYICT